MRILEVADMRCLVEKIEKLSLGDALFCGYVVYFPLTRVRTRNDFQLTDWEHATRLHSNPSSMQDVSHKNLVINGLDPTGLL